jgi:hypothetical protein
VTGVEDDVNDVIEPGAFRRTLRERQASKASSAMTGCERSRSPRKPSS